MKKRTWPLLGELFVTFLKVGPVTFGGGYAMIPAIEREVVDKRAWIPEHEMSDVLSVAGSAPGGIGVNAAAFVGYRMAGLAGAAAAVLGITLPTFLLALALSLIYANVGHYPKIEAALQGIHAAIFGLIIVAAYRMGRQAVYDKTTFASAVCTLVLLLSAPVHPLFVIAAGLWLGIVVVMIKQKLGIVVQFSGKTAEEANSTGTGHKYADYFIADGI
ncbi:chromate transporter [Paenibacillus puerhi]|uniref:chromate transporter n=1 Tax=Paenibacillus puerhi TaxID=2692622 RepID=UPI0013587404|nr:chromate transporter [Paenibacillus puerhi]